MGGGGSVGVGCEQRRGLVGVGGEGEEGDGVGAASGPGAWVQLVPWGLSSHYQEVFTFAIVIEKRLLLSVISGIAVKIPQ